jgi:hypothetical protein
MAAGMGAAILLGDVASESRVKLVHSLTTRTGLANLLAIFAVVVLPPSLPMAIVGGVLAVAAVRAEPPGRSTWSWVSRGAAYGAALGALGCVLWFGAINLGNPSTLGFALLMGAVGGIAGTPVGAAVGAYSAWVSRGLLPNKQRQPTRPAQS